jgi:hypothetical protein
MHWYDWLGIAWLAIGIPTGLWSARWGYVRAKLGQKVWGERVEDRDLGFMMFVQFALGLCWPVSGIVMGAALGLRHWFQAPIRKHEARKKALRDQMEKYMELGLASTDLEEKQLLMNYYADLSREYKDLM